MPVRACTMSSTEDTQPLWRPGPLSRPLWYPVAGAAALLALLAGAAMTLLTVSHGSRGRPLAGNCGLVTCAASLPRDVTVAAAPAAATARPRRAAPQLTIQPVLAPKTHPIPAKGPSAPPTAQPSSPPNPGHSHHHHHRHGQR
jgi:hypothetical protein